MPRAIVLENGRLRQLRDNGSLTGVQRFTQGENISFTTNSVTGRITISAAAGSGGGGTSTSSGNIDGGVPNSIYGGVTIIDGGGVSG